MQMYEIRKGQVLMCRFRGGPLEPVRVDNPKIKKITVMRQNGERWDVYATSLHPNTDNVPFDLKVDEAEGLCPGVVVRFRAGTTNHARYPGIYVITSQTQAGFRMSKLFGDGGRYFHSIPAAALEIITKEDLIEVFIDED